MKRLTSAGVALIALSGAAAADQVFGTNVIINNNSSLCVGDGCVDGENFGSDTIRLKENNLRIHFDDNSNSGSFPANDWRITINSSDNGGGSYFAIDDVTAGRTPFTVEAGASSNALYVESDGDLGLGTSDPVLELHIKDGDSPGIRIEQDGSSGFQAQIWDIAGNETNFFVRDVTNGSKIPFKIKPNAPNNALFIAADGDIGMGTQSPGASMHMTGSAGDMQMRIEETSATSGARDMIVLKNNGRPDIVMSNENTGNEWSFGAGTNLVFKQGAVGSASGDKTKLFEVKGGTGNVEIAGSLFTAGGTCGSGCDLVFEDGYDMPTIEEHAAEMWALGYLPNVGPTPEGARINLSDKLGRMLNELEKAHIFIAELDARDRAAQARIAELSAQLEARGAE